MVSLISKVAIVGVVFIAILYQYVFKTIIFQTLGYGRSMQSLDVFSNVHCNKIDELGLEGCEDMWLHDKTGFLYMACSDSESRVQWLPATDKFNVSGRSLRDRIAILDTRGPGRLASRIKWITAQNFPGINGDGTFNLHGFDVRADSHTDTLRILLINHRPPFDSVTGELLDASKVGANSTIEQFQTSAGSDTMRHIRTYAHEVIETPNRVQWVNDHAFVFSNDHSRKTGIRRGLDLFLGGTSIGYCDRNRCNIARTFGADFGLPNGLVRGPDGLIYVPSTLSGEIRAFALNENHTLDFVSSIPTPLPIDNLSFDRDGDLYTASIPQIYKWSESAQRPFDVKVPSAVFRVSNVGLRKWKRGTASISDGGFEVKKIMEDDGTTLPGATIAVHDAETGRIFLGGAMAPFITICETR